MGIFTRQIDKNYEQRSTPATILPPSRSAVYASPELALGLTSVYRSVNIISTTVSQLPLLVHRDGVQVESKLADRPDINRTTTEFWGMTATSLALHGNAFWWVSRKQDGTPQNLTVLDPQAVGVSQDEKGNLRYDYSGKQVRKANIQHLRLFPQAGIPLGLGPVQAARGDVETALRLRSFGDDFLETGGIPTGVLSTDQFINQEQADAYRKNWDEAQSKRGLAVLGAGMNYSPISMTPEDIQFLESRRYSSMEIARLFGIPPIYLGLGIEGSSLTYATTESLGILFLQTTLTAYIKSVEEAFTDLLPRGQKARFKLDALLRADLSTRVASYEKLVAMGAMSADEVRKSEGMTPTIWSNETGAPTNQENDGAPL